MHRAHTSRPLTDVRQRPVSSWWRECHWCSTFMTARLHLCFPLQYHLVPLSCCRPHCCMLHLHLMLLCALATPSSMTSLPHSVPHHSPSNPLSKALHDTCMDATTECSHIHRSSRQPNPAALYAPPVMHALPPHCCIVC